MHHSLRVYDSVWVCAASSTTTHGAAANNSGWLGYFYGECFFLFVTLSSYHTHIQLSFICSLICVSLPFSLLNSFSISLLFYFHYSVFLLSHNFLITTLSVTSRNDSEPQTSHLTWKNNTHTHKPRCKDVLYIGALTHPQLSHTAHYLNSSLLFRNQELDILYILIFKYFIVSLIYEWLLMIFISLAALH